jgi:hypothetical protein
MDNSMNDGDKKVCSMCHGCMSGCGCGMHGRGFGWVIIKVIVGLVIFGVIFSFGVLVGELKMALRESGFGGSVMMRGYAGQYPMMSGGYTVPGATSTGR